MSRLHHLRSAAFACALALLPAAGAVSAQLAPLPYDRGATGLGLALRKLPVGASVLYTTAHPDDENNAVLVALSRGRGVRTGLLTATRGDGGQNEIGSELFEALGVLRTEELAAVHRYDGAAQFFTRAFEFGYSFSVEETFEKWGREEILADFVRVMRSFRPDVVITLPREAPGGGQHHQAAGRLAVEAFRAAADPARFPEQVREGLPAWQARKVYEGGVGGSNETAAGPIATVRTGEFDPLLGMTWAQLGSIARTSHKCQGMGQIVAAAGPADFKYVLVDSEPKTAATEQDVLDGIDVTVRGLARFARGDDAVSVTSALAEIQSAAERALAGFDGRALHKSVPALAEGLNAVRSLKLRLETARLDDTGRDELRRRLSWKEAEFEAALTLAQGFLFEATAADGDVVRGQEFGVSVRAFNGGSEPVHLDAVELSTPQGWSVATAAPATLGALDAGRNIEAKFDVTVGEEARYSQPYWKRNPAVDRFDIELPAHQTLPWSPADLVARVRYTAAGVSATIDAPVVWKYKGPWVGGEKRKTVNVVPVLSVVVSPRIAVFPTSVPRARREFKVSVLNNALGARTGSVRLEVPPGFTVEPREAALTFLGTGDEVSATFAVTAPAGLVPGEISIHAIAAADGREYREGYQVIAYDHTEERHLFRPAAARALALDVRVSPNANVGYVMGSGDEVPEAVRQIGARVTQLTGDDLASGDLSRFTTVVVGIRAYENVRDLKAFNHRLLDFAKRGGHLVVQYNRAPFNQREALEPFRPGGPGGRNTPPPDSPYAPFPAAVTPERITDENAPLQALVATHPLLVAPNRLGEPDWRGWVQERGIQFLDARDSRYVQVLAATDPFPKNAGEKKGMLVEAALEKGTWTYVALGLFRQLPAGVPGAYRLLANLVSRPRGR